MRFFFFIEDCKRLDAFLCSKLDGIFPRVNSPQAPPTAALVLRPCPILLGRRFDEPRRGNVSFFMYKNYPSVKSSWCCRLGVAVPSVWSLACVYVVLRNYF